MRHAFAAVAVAAAAFSLAFLVVPVVALFVHVPPGDLLQGRLIYIDLVSI